jgi:amino acid transporter
MGETSTEAGPAQAELGLWDAVSIIVGIVVGTGIFVLPEPIFSNVRGPWLGLLVWVAGGVLALIGALCYAELATAYPKTGGDYEYLTRAFGPWVGFSFGWAQLAVILTSSIGQMAFVFAYYAAEIWPESGVPGFAVAAAVVLGLTLLNLLGVFFGKTTQNVLTVVKILGLLGVLYVGFRHANPDLWQPSSPRDDIPLPWGSVAIILVLYTFGGWNDAAFVAAEVRDRRRNIPRALLLGVGLITLIYLLVNLAYLLCLGFDGAAGGRGPIGARLIARSGWQFGPQAFSALVMISALGAMNGLIFAGSRVYTRLGQDHSFFASLGRWHPRRRTPVWAMLVQALICLLYILVLGTTTGQAAINSILTGLRLQEETAWQPTQGFQMLVDCTAPVFWFFFFLTGVSLMVLRSKDPATERPFRVPLYPVVPLIFCAMCLYMLYSAITYRGWFTAPAGVLVLLGVPLFFLSKRK